MLASPFLPLTFPPSSSLIKFKSIHLKQQATERAALQGKKDEALNSYDAAGNPTHLLLFSDGMTKHAGNTPKYGLR